MSAQINELINRPSNFEYIRDITGIILAEEFAHQFELATQADLPNKRDYDVKVFIENDRPFDGNIAANFPCVNISIGKVSGSIKRGAVNYQSMTADYYIDCYAIGNKSAADGSRNDSQYAGLKSVFIAGIARSILMAGIYTYLGARDIVASRNVKEIQFAEMPKPSESALAVKVSRLIMQVEFIEESPQVELTPLERIDLTGKTEVNGLDVDLFKLQFGEEEAA